MVRSEFPSSRLGLELLVILLILGSAGVLGVVLSKWPAGALSNLSQLGGTPRGRTPDVTTRSSERRDWISDQDGAPRGSNKARLRRIRCSKRNAHADGRYRTTRSSVRCSSEIGDRHPDDGGVHDCVCCVMSRDAAGDMEPVVRLLASSISGTAGRSARCASMRWLPHGSAGLPASRGVRSSPDLPVTARCPNRHR